MLHSKKRGIPASRAGDLTLPMNTSQPCDIPNSIYAKGLPSEQPVTNAGQLTRCSTISCFYTNIQGLVSKLAEFRHIVLSSKFSLIGLTETWLTDEITDAEVTPLEYSVLRSDRGSRGGGVALLFSSQLHVITINDPLIKSRDSLWCLLSLSMERIYVWLQ